MSVEKRGKAKNSAQHTTGKIDTKQHDGEDTEWDGVIESEWMRWIG